MSNSQVIHTYLYSLIEDALTNSHTYPLRPNLVVLRIVLNAVSMVLYPSNSLITLGKITTPSKQQARVTDLCLRLARKEGEPLSLTRR
jgi:hypothetical protein